MDGKKILIVSRSFYPMNSPRAIRTTELVKEFAKQGHSVTLLTVKNEEYHTSFEKEHNVVIKDVGKLSFPAITFTKREGVIFFLKRILNRLLLLFFEYPDIELMFKVKNALKNVSGHDLMISIAAPYPVHWGVAWAKTKNDNIANTWIADCGDPYYGRENDSFKIPFYFSYFEKWFCRKADFITIPIEEARSAYFEEFQSKIRIIPQGLSFPDSIEKEKRSKNNEVTTLAYFGNIESYVHYAVPFMKKLNSIDENFNFIVYTRRKDLFEEHLNALTLAKCSISDYVERYELFRKLRYVDFLVHFPYRNESQKSLKLVDYYFLDKPILEYKNDDNSDKILEEFFKGDYSHKRKDESVKKYRIENVCKQFLNLLCENNSSVKSQKVLHTNMHKYANS